MFKKRRWFLLDSDPKKYAKVTKIYVRALGLPKVVIVRKGKNDQI